MPRRNEATSRESVSDRETNENHGSNKFLGKDKMHRSNDVICRCKEDACLSDRTLCLTPRLKMPLKTEFRKKIYSKYEDLLSTIFDFEENTNKRIESDQNAIDQLANEMKNMNSKGSANQRSEKEKEKMYSDLNALRNHHELEKMNLIREKNEHLKEAVAKFEDYFNRIQKAMDHHWKQNAAFRKKENERLENEYAQVKNSFMIQINKKSEEIHKLKEMIKQLENQNRSFKNEQVELNMNKKDITDMINEIHSIHGDLCRKYRKLSEIVMTT